MPQYKIYAEFGFAGTQIEDTVEADSLEQAEAMAWESAIQYVNSWAEEVDEEEEELDV
jgi:hypothetical protein